jgi:HK97 family phage major capsid protein
MGRVRETSDERAIRELSQSVTEIVDEIVPRLTALEQRVGAGVPRRRNGPMPGAGDVDEGGVFAQVSTDRYVQQLHSLRGRERLAALTVFPSDAVAEATGRPLEEVRAFQEASDALVIMSTILRRQAPDPHEFNPRELGFYRDTYLPLTQAMDSTTAGEGDEYVPTLLSGSLIERIQLELQVARLFEQVEMPSNPFEIPGIALTRQRGATHAEQTADTGQTKIAKRTPATRKITLSAVKFAVMALLSREYEEDSLIAAIPHLQSELVDYIGGDLEDAIVNGDTTAPHMDSDTTDADDPRKAWIGLRKAAIAATKTDGANAALTAAMLRVNRKKMEQYGVRGDQLAHIVSMAGYNQLLADTATLTLEKYGPQAVVLTGELAKVDGVPVIVSQYVRQDLNATGVHDGVTTNRTVALTVNRRGWFFGNRRDMTVQVLTEAFADSDQDGVIASVRKAFAPRYPTATEKIVALHYNLQT